MTELGCDELPPELEAGERAALEETAALLFAARPRPGPAFRGELRRQTVCRGARLAPRPPGLRRRVLGFLALGAVLIALGASGLTGRGPLAPPTDGAGHVAQVR